MTGTLSPEAILPTHMRGMGLGEALKVQAGGIHIPLCGETHIVPAFSDIMVTSQQKENTT